MCLKIPRPKAFNVLSGQKCMKYFAKKIHCWNYGQYSCFLSCWPWNLFKSYEIWCTPLRGLVYFLCSSSHPYMDSFASLSTWWVSGSSCVYTNRNMSWGLSVKIWVVNVLCTVASLQVFATDYICFAQIFSIFHSIIVKLGAGDVNRNYWMVCEFCENRCSESHSLVKGINWYCVLSTLVWGKFRILFIMSSMCVSLVMIIRPTWNNVGIIKCTTHSTANRLWSSMKHSVQTCILAFLVSRLLRATRLSQFTIL